jgi:hypothetical protein
MRWPQSWGLSSNKLDSQLPEQLSPAEGYNGAWSFS